MNSRATILLSLHDVELVDPDSVRPLLMRLRFGRLRIFVLSVLLGLTIGMTFCEMDPTRSKHASHELRARLRSAPASLAANAARQLARLR